MPTFRGVILSRPCEFTTWIYPTQKFRSYLKDSEWFPDYPRCFFIDGKQIAGIERAALVHGIVGREVRRDMTILPPLKRP